MAVRFNVYDLLNIISKRIKIFIDNLTPIVKLLLLLNIGVYIIQFIGGNILHIPFFLTTIKIIDNKSIVDFSEFFKIFSFYFPYLKKYFLLSQFLTYQFVHSGFMHLFFSILLLGSAGPFVERQIGARPFLKLYLLSGVFAGFCQLLFAKIGCNSIAGASCSICAVWSTFAFMNPSIKLMIIPGVPKSTVSAKMLIQIYAGLTLVMAFLSGNPIIHFANLGGMLFGYLYVKNVWGLKKIIG